MNVGRLIDSCFTFLLIASLCTAENGIKLLMTRSSHPRYLCHFQLHFLIFSLNQSLITSIVIFDMRYEIRIACTAFLSRLRTNLAFPNAFITAFIREEFESQSFPGVLGFCHCILGKCTCGENNEQEEQRKKSSIAMIFTIKNFYFYLSSNSNLSCLSKEGSKF